jgi:hypothetical protein
MRFYCITIAAAALTPHFLADVASFKNLLCTSQEVNVVQTLIQQQATHTHSYICGEVNG